MHVLLHMCTRRTIQFRFSYSYILGTDQQKFTQSFTFIGHKSSLAGNEWIGVAELGSYPRRQEGLCVRPLLLSRGSAGERVRFFDFVRTGTRASQAGPGLGRDDGILFVSAVDALRTPAVGHCLTDLLRYSRCHRRRSHAPCGPHSAAEASILRGERTVGTRELGADLADERVVAAEELLVTLERGLVGAPASLSTYPRRPRLCQVLVDAARPTPN